MKNEEHKILIENISTLFSEFEKLPFTIENTDIGYSEHGDYISWINHQIVSLKDTFNLLQENSYKSVFSLIRTVFEAYWIINLSMNGTKYYIDYMPEKGHNIQKIYQKLVKDFETNKSNMTKIGILEIQPPKNNKIKLVYSGLRNKDGKIIPKYYFLFKDYNPEIAYLGLEDSYHEDENFNIIRDKLIKKHKDLKWFFSFQRGIKYHLLLNNLVTEEEYKRAMVHYNFLSMWVHPSINSIQFIQKNVHGMGDFKEIKKYDFFLTRLALIYIGNIMCLFLNSFLKFSERQIIEKKIISIRHKSDFEKSINDFLDLTSYFWFIYNEPHYYYKYKFVIKLLGKRPPDEIKKINISNLKASDIEYYKNPINILEDLSISWRNKVIGECKSPIEKESLK